MDTWFEIREFQRRQRAVSARLRRRRAKRYEVLSAAGIAVPPFPPSPPSSSSSSPLLPGDRAGLAPVLERRALEQLLSPVLEFPVTCRELSVRLTAREELVREMLLKFSAQGLLELLASENAVASVNADKLSVLAEVDGPGREEGGGGKGGGGGKMVSPLEETLEYLLNTPSIREMESRRMGTEILDLLNSKSVMEQRQLEKFQSSGGSQLQEFCSHKTRESCRRARGSRESCDKLHFRKIIQPHTDESLGDCSFLNTCFHMDTCKFVHYEIASQREEATATNTRAVAKTKPSTAVSSHQLIPPQWVNCDLRSLDMTCLGKFSVVMADPPWDIHMELPYGTMEDDEMRQLNIPALQDDGYIFLWVTGRAMELGRDCLTLWGYERIDEIIWVKTNQLQRLIRTGRTGHWLNHGKEHCLVGVKGNLPVNRGIDVDVIVAEVRETSHKPDEIYGIIERLSPGTLKIELFGRMHNCQPNWLTVGNQLEGIQLVEEERAETFWARYPRGDLDTFPQKMAATPAAMIHSR